MNIKDLLQQASEKINSMSPTELKERFERVGFSPELIDNQYIWKSTESRCISGESYITIKVEKIFQSKGIEQQFCANDDEPMAA